MGRLRGAPMNVAASDRAAAAVLAITLFTATIAAAPGAQASAGQTSAGQTPADRPTFRAGTRLATFDAVVTDSKGRHVTDLAPADFEVVERGKRQTVRQVAYVHAARPDGSASAAADAAGAAATPDIVMPGRTGLPSRDQTGRVMAFVIDDLRMSFRSIVDVRRMLHRYVDAHVQPGDLVAIIRTAGGAGTLQQFTTDRRLLKAAVEKVQWSARVWPYDPVGPWERGGGGLADRFEREVTLEGTLGALAYAVRGVQALPGRKTVVFVSEGFPLVTPDIESNDALPEVEQVINDANRGGVVMYAIDPRGLVNPIVGLGGPFSAQRSGSDPSYTGRSPMPVLPATLSANGRLLETQAALQYLAEQTGGFAVVSSNDLSGGLRRIADDTRGYYLIGFDTGVAPGVRADRGDVRIRVKRKGLEVRSRRDRFGPADPEAPPAPAPADPLISAALSPFATGGLDVRLAALFGHDAAEGLFVRTLVAVDPAGLTLTETPGGGREGDLTLLVFALDDAGWVVGQAREIIAVRLDADAYARAREHGLRYGVRLPFKKAGGYQVRAAVVDERSRAIGASAQFVQVPRVGAGRLALSGVVLSMAGSASQPLATVFARRSRLEYRGTIYDGRRGDGGVATQATVLRDGRPVYSSPAAPVATASAGTAEVAPLPFAGTLALGDDLTPGVYTLQVSVVPATEGAKGPRAVQWVDFEVR
ncbi:MAG: VWA domain-containing protein [Vicinamibacteraceae bacterium]